MATVLLSFILLTGAVQDTTVDVSQEALRKLESRVQNLESKVQRYESAESYFKTVLNSERVWWSTLVLVIISVGGVLGYTKVTREVKKVSEEMDEFRDEFNDLRDDQLGHVHNLSITESEIYKEQERYFRAAVSVVHAIESLVKKSEIGKPEKSNIKFCSEKTLEYLDKSIESGEVVNKHNYEGLRNVLSDLINETEGVASSNIANAFNKTDDLFVEELGVESNK